MGCLPFSDQEYDRRLSACLSAMVEQDLDALLLMRPESLAWLTGCGSLDGLAADGQFRALLLFSDGRCLLYGREGDLVRAAGSRIQDQAILEERFGADIYEAFAAVIRDQGLRGASLGLELDCPGLSFSRGLRLTGHLEEMCDILDISPLLPFLQLQRSDEEIAFLRRIARDFAPCLDNIRAALRLDSRPEDIRHRISTCLLESGTAGSLPVILSGDGQTRSVELFPGRAGYHVPLALSCVTDRADDKLARLFPLLRELAEQSLEIAASRLVAGQTPAAVQAALQEALSPVAGMTGGAFRALPGAGYNPGLRFSPTASVWPMLVPDQELALESGMVFYLRCQIADRSGNCLVHYGDCRLVEANGPAARLLPSFVLSS